MRLRTIDEPFQIQVDDSVLEVQPLSAAERAELAQETLPRGRDPSPSEIAEFNAALFARTVKKFIHGVCDEAGKELQATDPIKRVLAELNPRWAQQVLSAAETIPAAVEESARKNWWNTQARSSPGEEAA